MALEINGINHVCVSVANIEETIQWYSNVFGFAVAHRSVLPGVNIKTAHLQGKGFLLEIFEVEGSNALPEERKIPLMDLMTQGNKHFSLGVPNGHKALDQLKNMGVDIVMEADADGTYSIFIHDNSGNLIEIFEEAGDNIFNQHK